MVERKSRINVVLPMILSLAVIVLYRYLELKFAVALIVGIIGFVLVNYNIKIGILGATFLMPFMPDKIGLAMMLSLSVFFFIKYVLIESKPLKATIFGAIIGVYFIIACIATFTSISLSGSIRDIGLHMGGLSYAFVVINTIETKEDLNTLLTVLMVSATLVALYGVLQYFTGVEIAREWMDVESSPDISARVYSVFGNPNILAEYLVILCPIGVGMMWQTKSIKKKPIFFLGAVSMLIALILTMSRGGWLGIAFAALVFVLLVDRRLLLLAIPIVIAAFFLLPTSILNRITSIGNMADSSIKHRFDILNVTFNVIRDNWVAGVGFGYLPFKMVFETYNRYINMYHVHNTYLQTMGELGIPAFTIFATMLFTFIKYPILKLVKRKDDTYYRYVGAGIVAGLVGILSQGFFESILYLPRIIFIFWTVVGIMIAMVNIASKDNDIELNSIDQSVVVKRGNRK